MIFTTNWARQKQQSPKRATANPNNPWYGTSGGNATTDKVFLLSLDEVVKYFGDSGDLLNKRRKDYKGNAVSAGDSLYDEYNDSRIVKNGKDKER